MESSTVKRLGRPRSVRVDLGSGLSPLRGRKRQPVSQQVSLLLMVAISLALNTALYAHNRFTRLSLGNVAVRASLLERFWAWAVTLPGGLNGAGVWPISQLRSPADGTSMRTFRVQRSRADYRVTVTDALEELGLRQVNESSWDFDVFWGHQWADHEAYFDKRLRRHMLISSIPGLMAETIGDKDFLGLALQLCTAQHGQAPCDFVPPMYTMPMQALEWRRAFVRHRYWIRKDRKLWGSQGVSIISSKRDLPADVSYQLQQYIAQPLLWNGYKHDIRLWAVLTSASPLRLYLLQDGWARVAARPYDGDSIEKNAGDACMHLTANYCPELPHDSLRLLRSNTAAYRNGLA